MGRIICIAMILCFTMVTSVQSEKSSELAKMAAFVTDQNIEIKKWQITIKEKMNIPTLDEIRLQLDDKFNKIEIKDENLLKFIYEDHHKSQYYNVQYNIVLPQDYLTQPELIVVIEGDYWSEDIEASLHQDLSSITGNFFIDKFRLFSWLKTEPNDIINNGVFVKNIKKYFELTNVKVQEDFTDNVERKYIYGLTNQWNDKIMMDNTPTNVQIAITSKKNGHPELTLGTPILITEY